jgi:hypothetical protein
MRDLYELGDLHRTEYVARREAINAELSALTPAPIPDLDQLQALHVGAPGALRERVDPARNGATLARRLTGMRIHPNASLQENTTLQVLRDIANRTRALDTQAAAYTRQIDELTHELAPTLLDEPGVGPITAGKLIAFNPARFKSEAAFARANGTAPQPASSGQNRPSPPQPRRRPTNQHSDLHDRALRLHPPPSQPRLHPTPRRGRQDQARGHEIPQAIPLPRPLPTLRENALDNIEASNGFRCRTLGASRACQQRRRRPQNKPRRPRDDR